MDPVSLDCLVDVLVAGGNVLIHDLCLVVLEVRRWVDFHILGCHLAYDGVAQFQVLLSLGKEEDDIVPVFPLGLACIAWAVLV